MLSSRSIWCSNLLKRSSYFVKFECVKKVSCIKKNE
jgi:hypothetical protein